MEATVLPVTSNVTSGAPTAMSSPSDPCTIRITPANGDGISTTAFAVSTSTSGWFSSTVAPSADSHRTILPSSSPSPRSGMTKTRSVI